MKILACMLVVVAGLACASAASAQVIGDDEFHWNVREGRVTYAGTFMTEDPVLGPIRPALSIGSFSIGEDSDELYAAAGLRLGDRLFVQWVAGYLNYDDKFGDGDDATFSTFEGVGGIGTVGFQTGDSGFSVKLFHQFGDDAAHDTVLGWSFGIFSLSPL
ncbi:hypothetical protein [Candidatus Palauibacter sp.]|uniref:hypothetical protein n=1 Tax=Candidatus Palauibacter sp. TaxID=3101350 RepID=UPI003B02B69A